MAKLGDRVSQLRFIKFPLLLYSIEWKQVSLICWNFNMIFSKHIKKISKILEKLHRLLSEKTDKVWREVCFIQIKIRGFRVKLMICCPKDYCTVAFSQMEGRRRTWSNNCAVRGVFIILSMWFISCTCGFCVETKQSQYVDGDKRREIGRKSETNIEMPAGIKLATRR